MRSHPILLAIFLAYIAWGAWHWAATRPVREPDGVLAEGDPQQDNIKDGEKVRMGHWTLTVRASYQVKARVLASEHYHFDSLADLVPEDLALGWGPMSDNRVLRDVDISQSNRFYYWHVGAAAGISREAIVTHSANTHVIPRDALVARELSKVRPGEVVTLSGALVDGLRDDGRWINTSLVRNDTGPGACEVMLVSDVVR